MKNWFANLTMMAFASFLLAACGGDSGTTNSAPKISDADYEADSYKGLPKCSDELDGKTAYVVDQEQGYVCEKGEWVEDEAAVEIRSSSSGSMDQKGNSSSSNKSIVDTVITVDPETGDTIISLDTLAGVDSTLRKCAPEFDDKYMTYNGKTYRCYDDFWRPEKDPPKDTDAQVICLKTTDPNAPLKCYLDTAIWSSSSYVADPEDFVDQGVIKIKDGAITGVAQKGPYLQGSTYRIIPLDGKTLKPTGDTLSDQFNNSRGTYTFCDLNLPSQYAMIEASGYYRSELTGNKSNLQMTIGAIVDVQKGANINMITNLEYERVKYLVQNEGYNIAGAKKRALTEVLSAFHIENVTGSAEQLDITQDGEANGALLAISIMVQGVAGSEFNVIDMMKDFREDLKDDGQWTGKTARSVIADIAYEADSAGKLGGYRSNVAGWGLSNTVPAFEKYIKAFWGLEYGIGRCTEERYGEIKKNQNTASRHKDNYFICENGWRYIGEIEYNTKNNVCDVEGLVIPGNIDKDKYYICATRDYRRSWWEATDLEVDMYFTDCTQDGKLHRFSDGKLYKCSNDVFVEANYRDTRLGLGCVSYLDEETMIVPKGIYKYTCSQGFWNATKEWAVENCSKDGQIFGNGYVCDADTFRVATKQDYVDVDFYGSVCVKYLEGKTFEPENHIYSYTCENSLWVNSWSKSNCSKDGTIQELNYDENGSKNSFICDADTFRVATTFDSTNISVVGAVCVSYLDGQKGETSLKTPVKCSDGNWTFAGTYGMLSDSRDGKTYKTVVIGTQTWMAENLNYETKNSYCYKDNSGNCSTYGRLYTWGAAKGSACPSGWHLPTGEEFRILCNVVGDEGCLSSFRMFKSVSDYGSDTFGFGALSAGYKTKGSSSNGNTIAHYSYSKEAPTFWTSSATSADDAVCNEMGYRGAMSLAKSYGFSVRCVKD